MYDLEIKPTAVYKLKKLKKKDQKSFQNVISKLKEASILLETNPDHYKNLRKPLQDYKRIHVNKSFVLIFLVDEKNKKMIITNYEHHKRVYKKTYD
jgi:YafQ family addiction module toxin component